MTENEAKDILSIISWSKAFKGYTVDYEAINIARKALEEIQQYRAIGTVEECRTALERMKPKNPIYIEAESVRYTDSYRCPACGGAFTWTGIAGYCYRCGQAIDLQEE